MILDGKLTDLSKLQQHGSTVIYGKGGTPAMWLCVYSEAFTAVLFWPVEPRDDKDRTQAFP